MQMFTTAGSHARNLVQITWGEGEWQAASEGASRSMGGSWWVQGGFGGSSRGGGLLGFPSGGERGVWRA